jgi:hypothetical protein
MPGTPGPRTGLAQVNPTGESPTILRTTANAIISWLEANAMLTSAGLLSARPVSTPGTPGISGRRYYATDTGVEYRDTGTGWLALGVELVTALPATPYNGQIVDYLADATNGIVWRLRYRSASASTYKWEVVGGSALTAEVATGESRNNAVYGDLTTVGPAIALPLSGDYDFELLARAGAVAAAFGAMSISGPSAPFSGTASDSDFVEWQMNPATDYRLSGVRRVRKTGVVAQTVTAKYRTSGSAVTFGLRRLVAMPIRVG